MTHTTTIHTDPSHTLTSTPTERSLADFEAWFKFTYGRFANYADSPMIRAVALAAWEASASIMQERCAGIAGDVGAGLLTTVTKGVEVNAKSLGEVGFAIARKIRGKAA